MTYKIKLKPSYDSRKSFYGKAVVTSDDGNKILRSYNTDVAEIKNGKAYVYGTYSQTTLRHIKEFLLQNGFKAENSKQIMKDYGADKDKLPAYSVKKEISKSVPISPSKSDNVFKINDRMEIVAEADKTRNGFKHTARLFVDGNEVDKSTAHYLNRTWESYEFQSVVDDLIDKTSYIPQKDKKKLKDIFSGEAHEEVERQFGTIGKIASLGEVFGKTEKEKNAWKLRMIKAGLGEGFEVPSDWDKLSEKEKGKRLDAVIKHLNK